MLKRVGLARLIRRNSTRHFAEGLEILLPIQGWLVLSSEGLPRTGGRKVREPRQLWNCLDLNRVCRAMGIFNRTMALAAIALLSVAAFGQTSKRLADLMVGDPAPKLDVAKWVKGTPVRSLHEGKIYVVEFWATWCGPCKVSIPHLTELQKKFGDKATFIGVSCFENNWQGVAPFVKSEGSQMDYNVAMDKIAHPTDREGFMAKNWMEAAHQPGIPTAFIIDKDEKVAWIGHPMNLEDPLAKVIDGTWDRDAAAKTFAASLQEEADEENSPLAKVQRQYSTDMHDKNWTAAIADIDGAEKLLPGKAPQADLMRLQVYAASGDSTMYGEIAGKLMSGPMSDQPMLLNSIAWSIVDPKTTFKQRDLALAQTAAERAVSTSGRKDSAILDTLAWTYHWMGNNDKAIATEQEALSKAADADKGTYQTTLNTFQAAKG
jgi:thiol-disulfide isomerase/thioredoxin